MTTAAALIAAKNRLNITGTDFDTQLTDFFDTSVDRLNPKVLKQIPTQTVTVSVDNYGECNVDLATLVTPLEDVRYVEASEGAQWYPADYIYRHGTNLRVYQLSSLVTQLRLYGLNPYVVTTTGGEGSLPGVVLPERYELPVVWYMMAEFYDMLVGNKSKFNIYQQANGSRSMDDMQAESEYYENKAMSYIDERAELLGAQ